MIICLIFLQKMDPGLGSLYFQFIKGLNEETGFRVRAADKATVFSLLKQQRLIALGQAEGELVLKQSSKSDKFSRLVLKYKEGLNRFEGVMRRRGSVLLAVWLAFGVLLAAMSLLAWTTAISFGLTSILWSLDLSA